MTWAHRLAWLDLHPYELAAELDGHSVVLIPEISREDEASYMEQVIEAHLSSADDQAPA
ncbi:MAG: hypothetical protein M3Q52_06590 [Pseudomonadota bacterium]|nr:hypothetical protein [Pseudomonadota bacterium]